MTFANAALDALAGARASLRPTKSVVTKGDGSIKDGAAAG